MSNINTYQQEAIELLMEKYNVTAAAALPDGRARVETTNGPTPYLFIDSDGAVEDEDGNGVYL